ncbi:TIM barrel protein [Actinophytocola sp.]|uniref:TIM barrel protein n=1 Tax=Actinophytocola sp. TaxID=1872138 RepID=UPI002D26CCC5|nr:TIM barrel protein [Actinophytocola sp.]HYQ68260.1 TIM barrel protein [Actinophytocola sp.]
MVTAELERTTEPTSVTRPARLTIATVCLSGTLEDKLAAAASAGFDGVELAQDDLVASPLAPEHVRQRCADLGLTIDLYQPFHDFESVPPDVFRANLRRAERKFDLMARLDVRTLLVCSTMSADAFDDDELAAEQLHTLAEHAGARGLRIAYEALAWGRFVDTVDHAWRVVRRAAHPALGLCLDSFHALARGRDLTGLRVIPGAKVFALQLADAPPRHMDLEQWSTHHRLFPGQGAFDLAAFARTVLATGYAGPISLEVSNDVFRQTDPRRTAIDAMRSLIAVRDGFAAQPAAPAPQPTGHAFTELSVDDISGPVLESALSSLGFAHTGGHRSKPVQLWEQGEARVLLNATPRATAIPGTGEVIALGLESPDPTASAARAERLLAPVRPRTRQRREADLPSVSTPDGITVLFCRTGAEQDDWLADFTPTGATAGGPLCATDHVSLTQPFDGFDQSTLFYRAVLGLRAQSATEFAAPFGLIRSRGATDPHHRVRITLNAALYRRGQWAPAVPEPQHVAFRTDDAIAAARTLRELGAPLLAISENYYDDLDARFELPADLLADLKAHSVLYDRDEHGEYFHFYTEMLANRVFFEVVQRVDGYHGYGAATSTPVRMTAHRQRRLVAATVIPAVPAARGEHEYSVAHLSALSLSPPELISAAADAGYDFVGLRLTRVTPDEPHYPVATDPALLRETKARLADTGVRVLDVELARIGPHDDPRTFQRYLEVGAELGARHVITQLPDANRDRKTEHFALLCDLARPLGLTIDLEFPSWTETPNLAEATYVLRTADRVNAGMLIDLLHFARSQSSIEELRELPREWFHFAHVCDAPARIPATVEGLIHTARFERLFPGEGGIDVRGVLDALPRNIPYALEIPRASLTAQVGERECLRRALATTRAHLKAPAGRP